MPCMLLQKECCISPSKHCLYLSNFMINQNQNMILWKKDGLDMSGKPKFSVLSLGLCVVRLARCVPGLGMALLTSRQPSRHCRAGHRWSRERPSLRPEGISSVLPGSDSPGIRPDWFSGADQTNNITFISFWP